MTAAMTSLPMADCHDDLLLAVQHRRERGDADPFGDFWLPQLRAGGVVLQVLPIYTEHQFLGEGALRRALQVIETARWMAERHRDEVAIVGTPAELQQAIDGGRIALVLAFEGMEPGKRGPQREPFRVPGKNPQHHRRDQAVRGLSPEATGREVPDTLVGGGVAP